MPKTPKKRKLRWKPEPFAWRLAGFPGVSSYTIYLKQEAGLLWFANLSARNIADSRPRV
ncbi:protein of unknown function [Methylocaldum szegediense]|uniref:Uncharacterized protein n=1 Tax=Methylocaldum szegediense TaxID=73780 RepID=A0ABM9HY49_9GAMM|nr:protein of unknown function [Methylocaldum szegediense]